MSALPPARLPAVPLVTHDPYFSVWSCADKLTDDWPRHWTRAINGMSGMVRIDGKAYRVLGPQPREAPAAEQTGLTVTPTRTTYQFRAGGVDLSLAFLTPLLPEDMDLVSRPITYLTWTASSADSAPHQVEAYLDLTAEWCVNTSNQRVSASRLRGEGMELLRFGSVDQAVLARSGDDLRIDWGYVYLVVPHEDWPRSDSPRTNPPGDGTPRGAASHSAIVRNDQTVITGHDTARRMYAEHGTLPAGDDLRFPRAVNDDWPVLACRVNLGTVTGLAASGNAGVADGVGRAWRTVMIAYDDQWSIEYFNRKLRPYWRRDGLEFDQLLTLAWRQFPDLLRRCTEFDRRLTDELTALGGEAYARLAVAAYRQTLAAHKLACDFDAAPLMFSKENFSNGCIATVDVIYPASPFFLALNPKMLEAQLRPVLEYARSPRWRHPFAPHDLGTYPLANGQVYGDGERGAINQMPVEESANMLLMLAALGKLDGKAALAGRYFAQCRKWADYLDEKGFDPANQLCTDDFAGHMAHNANLSIKAICALGAFAQMCETLKKPEDARTYRAIAEDLAGKWLAAAADGAEGSPDRHYRLAFDQPGTWSQKYNLIWDRVLDLKLFPPRVVQEETAFYRGKIGRFGLPLDSRATYTKLDWCVWTACLSGDRAEFDAQVTPLAGFLSATPQRVPMTDWFETTDARQSGFQARSVVGGVYMPMLCSPEVWKRWSTAGTGK